MTIIYDGVDITNDVSINQCVHDMYAERRADELLIRFNDTRLLWDGWSPKAGDGIEVREGAARTGHMFVRSLEPENGLYTLRASSVPPDALEKRDKSWATVWLLQIASEVAENSGLKLKTYGVTDQTYEYVDQRGQSDLELLQTLCSLEGLAFLVYDRALVIYDEAVLEAQTPEGTLSVTKADTFEYQDNSRSRYDAAEIKNGAYTGVYRVENGSDAKLSRMCRMRITSQGQADRFARAALRGANKRSVVAILYSNGFLDAYAPGSLLYLSTVGVVAWNGAYFITRVRHDYVNLKTKLFFRRVLEGY